MINMRELLSFLIDECGCVSVTYKWSEDKEVIRVDDSFILESHNDGYVLIEGGAAHEGMFASYGIVGSTFVIVLSDGIFKKAIPLSIN